MKLKQFLATTAVVATALACSAAQALTTNIDVSGRASNDVESAAGNVSFDVLLGAGAHITGVSYQVNLTAFSPSYLSEMTVSLLETTGVTGINLTPAFGDDFSGIFSYASVGTIDLVALGNDFTLGSDGKLRLSFFEGFNDLAGADGQWNAGSTLSLVYTVSAVPEAATGSMAMLGLTLVVGVAGRRKAAQRRRAA